ncbi:GGDEF domain-containing protein [Photobacterium lucens]|uniref:GGDEF domain-containing protein n=1 Tax=Photobacterium lucens TaxID=2562949 RepID=UPI00136FB27E|nr:GGDEF domain-containing protein [Photobacterium lucens]MBP2700003.1 GGDEF domain-containing protein [Vibrio parahaemolyticus]MZG57398.1 GGDEF domain-containing protein [Photobacterium lucens]MZG82889.1 GGDEF domain-containing protein [Photobacterium lucens]
MPDLDMRTVSFLASFFSLIFGIGLLFFHLEQKHFKGVKLIAISQLCISIATSLIFLRGQIPMWVSVLLSNMILCGGLTLCLYGFSQYREACSRLCKISLFGLVPLFIALLYFYFIQDSLNARAFSASLHFGITQLFACIVIFKGKALDNPIPKYTLGLAFGVVSLTMFIRATLVLNTDEISQYMQAGWVHQIPYLTLMFLIMAMSFNLVWLVNGRLTHSVEALSIRDNLTSLYNRRGMDKLTPQITTCNAKQPLPLIAMMCDIDHFKTINDKFGHLVGDQVIVNVSEQIQACVRVNDIAIRYGGEEFLILLPNTPLTNAHIVAERIRDAVHNIPVPHEGMSPISISIGVSQQYKGGDLDSLIREADKALYQAKQGGRNCVMIAPCECEEIRLKHA